jgi:hypothetical protein
MRTSVIAPGYIQTLRRKYAAQFGLSHLPRTDLARKLNSRVLGMLENCKDDSARRLILGVSEKEDGRR